MGSPYTLYVDSLYGTFYNLSRKNSDIFLQMFFDSRIKLIELYKAVENILKSSNNFLQHKP